MNHYVIRKMIQKPGNNRLDSLWSINQNDRLVIQQFYPIVINILFILLTCLENF